MDEIRGDLGELRHEVQLVNVRLEKMAERLEKLLEKGLREQTRFFFVAWGVILAAIIGLYGTVITLVR